MELVSKTNMYISIVGVFLIICIVLMMNQYVNCNKNKIQVLENFISEKEESISKLQGYDDSISFLTNTFSSPHCCPSTYTNDRGCICMNTQQKNDVIYRGANRIGRSAKGTISGLYEDI